ncbi:MAG: GRP family sugar transporter [Patescibacteria group bacterium]
MSWLIVIVIAYFLNASSTVIDKFLLSKKIPNPAVYAFFISALSLLGVVLIPFGFKAVSGTQVVISLVTGVVFAFSYLFMFKALNENEASRITPFMGGLQPIFVFFLAWFFLDEKLSAWAILAFGLLIFGTLVLSWQKETSAKKIKSSHKSYILAIIATFLFAVAYTLNKYVFVEQGFITGFVWIRIGTFLGAMLFLISPRNLKDIIKEIKTPKKQSSLLFVIGQSAGALSFILVSYAIAISKSVAVVNASRGLEYVFLLLIVITLAKRYPKLLSEKLTPKILIQKISATVLIVAGLVILAYAF